MLTKLLSKISKPKTKAVAPIAPKGTAMYRKELRSKCRMGHYPIAIQTVKGGVTIHAVFGGLCHPLYTAPNSTAAEEWAFRKLHAIPGSMLRVVFGQWRLVAMNGFDKAVAAA